MVDTKAVSVRLPLDLLNELNSYATDKGMVRGGDANIGGAIIAVLRQHFGEPDNVKQVSDNVDIERIVNNAVESRLEALLNQVELNLKPKLSGLIMPLVLKTTRLNTIKRRYRTRHIK
jgi:hypothetical protein